MLKNIFNHETKRNVLYKFLGVFIVVVLYFLFLSYKYGLADGFYITALTWSFFVLCTPVADAGAILDFPIRFLTGFRMMFTEIFVWVIAISLNTFTVFYNPAVYNINILLKLFYKILTNPIPFWSVIFISFIGTFLSLYFGDELIDVARHSERVKYKKHKNIYFFIVIIFLFGITFLIYDFILKSLGVHF